MAILADGSRVPVSPEDCKAQGVTRPGARLRVESANKIHRYRVRMADRFEQGPFRTET